MQKIYIIILITLLASCGGFEVADVYTAMQDISEQIQNCFTGTVGEDCFLEKIDPMQSLEDNLRAVAVRFQNAMEENLVQHGLTSESEFLFENQEYNFHAYIDFLDAVRFQKLKNISWSGRTIFPCFDFQNNTKCIVILQQSYSKIYDPWECQVIFILAQKNDMFVMYRKVVNGRSPYEIDESRIKNILAKMANSASNPKLKRIYDEAD